MKTGNTRFKSIHVVVSPYLRDLGLSLQVARQHHVAPLSHLSLRSVHMRVATAIENAHLVDYFRGFWISRVQCMMQEQWGGAGTLVYRYGPCRWRGCRKWVVMQGWMMEGGC